MRGSIANSNVLLDRKLAFLQVSWEDLSRPPSRGVEFGYVAGIILVWPWVILQWDCKKAFSETTFQIKPPLRPIYRSYRSMCYWGVTQGPCRAAYQRYSYCYCCWGRVCTLKTQNLQIWGCHSRSRCSKALCLDEWYLFLCVVVWCLHFYCISKSPSNRCLNMLMTSSSEMPPFWWIRVCNSPWLQYSVTM